MSFFSNAIANMKYSLSLLKHIDNIVNGIYWFPRVFYSRNILSCPQKKKKKLILLTAMRKSLGTQLKMQSSLDQRRKYRCTNLRLASFTYIYE